ncbi:4-hydroxy-tetrahydrodipicolinate reductase [Bhargavaea cecembensis]|uniref:4-hydroxy-tetrahydrodipicolinate reductase n=1 Tax=Bhargavaea cecembensis TaxID=394098 RepID=UPI00058E62CB|nr:4-hydroxy-tetrahydrodipicolinate reductase [Bhargavaea cecembensis]
MRLLLCGYGAMNRRVAALAEERGHEIAGVLLTRGSRAGGYPVYRPDERLPDADAVIDFSHPALTTALLAAGTGLPLVVATTGEKEALLEMMKESSAGQPVFFSANMSFGVHMLTEIVKYAASLLPSFDIELTERHHRKKVDAPSGTLVKLYDAIASVRPGVHPVHDRHQTEGRRTDEEIGIHSLRGGTISGEHEVLFAGHEETITIAHHAQSKDIFASGALDVAERLIGKANGFYTYDNLEVD